MTEELPHAYLRCTECGAGFRLTLKKGRIPSRPVPCPKCKSPVAVREEDVREGKRRSPSDSGSKELRSTQVQTLRKTQEVIVDPEATARLLHQLDEPAAKDASADKPPPSDPSVPGFGIVRRKKAGSPTGKNADDLGLTVTSSGVHVEKLCAGRARDRVFTPAPRGSSGSSGQALGKISIRRVAASSVDVKAGDPDLPVPAGMETAGLGNVETSDVEELALDAFGDVEEIDVALPDDADWGDEYDLERELSEAELSHVSEASEADETELGADAEAGAVERARPTGDVPVTFIAIAALIFVIAMLFGLYIAL